MTRCIFGLIFRAGKQHIGRNILQSIFRIDCQELKGPKKNVTPTHPRPPAHTNPHAHTQPPTHSCVAQSLILDGGC